MKTYICDEYIFDWTLSRELKQKIVKDVGETAYWVPCCAWNYLYSIYDNKEMSNQIAEVLYRPVEEYENEKIRIGNKSVI